jgi:hypothetical protein
MSLLCPGIWVVDGGENGDCCVSCELSEYWAASGGWWYVTAGALDSAFAELDEARMVKLSSELQ